MEVSQVSILYSGSFFSHQQAPVLVSSLREFFGFMDSEQLRPERISWDHIAQSSWLSSHLQTIAQEHIYMSFEYLQGVSLHNLSVAWAALGNPHPATHDDLNDWLNHRPCGLFKMFKLNYAWKRWSKHKINCWKLIFYKCEIYIFKVF